MLDHAPVARAAAPRVAQLARDCGAAAHLWGAGYDGQVVCALHASPLASGSAVWHLWHAAAAPASAAGAVLLAARARQRSCCYTNTAAEPAVAASVLQHGRVVAALAITGGAALQASGAVVTAAAGLSQDLGSASVRSARHAC